IEAYLKDAGAMSWGDVGKKLLSPTTWLRSGEQMAGDIYTAVRHPATTGKNIVNVIDGAGEMVEDALGIKVPPGREEDRRMYTRALGKMFLDRYGSIDKLKQTIASDPLGFLSDASTAIGGGGAVLRGTEFAAKAAGAAKTAGAIGKVAGATEKAAEITNPVTAAGKVGGVAAKKGYKIGTDIYGTATGTTGEPIRKAVSASARRFTDPARYKAFIDAFTETAPKEQVVSEAQGAVSNLIRQRGNTYRQEMAKVKLNRAPLNFQKIDDALIDTLGEHTVVTQSGQIIQKNPLAAQALKDVEEVLSEFRNLPPGDFTVEIADAMKQRLNAIKEGGQYKDQFGRSNTGGHVIDNVARAVRGVIEQQSPEYAKIMRGYEEATKDLAQVQKELSLGRDANAGVALRKLQSGLRNNVSSAYGHRKALIEFLEDNGAPHLSEMLAGQALSETTSRGGLGRLFTALSTGEVLTGRGLIGAAGLAATSPKLAGHAARAAGTAAAPFVYAADLAEKSPRIGKLAKAGVRGYARDIQRRGRYFGNLPQDEVSGEDKSPLSGDDTAAAGKPTGVDVEVKPTGGVMGAIKRGLSAIGAPAAEPATHYKEGDIVDSLGIRG
ncbi:MAG TPA: hypothetical protein VGF90_04205, partial [Verrucomicrobiae bacterium]